MIIEDYEKALTCVNEKIDMCKNFCNNINGYSVLLAHSEQQQQHIVDLQSSCMGEKLRIISEMDKIYETNNSAVCCAD